MLRGWPGASPPVRGDAGAAAQSPAGYTADATVTQYGKNGDALKTYRFVGLFPIDIEPIGLDWGTNDSIEEYGITFAYQWWEATTTS